MRRRRRPKGVARITRFSPERSIPNVIPSERTRSTDAVAFVRAVYANMEAPVDELVGRLDPPVDFVLTSTVLSWVGSIAKQRNVPVTSLWSDLPTVFFVFHYFENPVADHEQFKPSGNYSVHLWTKRQSNILQARRHVLCTEVVRRNASEVDVVIGSVHK